MWTEEHRAIHRRDGKGFPSDLRDAEWVRLEPLIPPARLAAEALAKQLGDIRLVVNDEDADNHADPSVSL